jgi:hypothetical protein
MSLLSTTYRTTNSNAYAYAIYRISYTFNNAYIFTSDSRYCYANSFSDASYFNTYSSTYTMPVIYRHRSEL